MTLNENGEQTVHPATLPERKAFIRHARQLAEYDVDLSLTDLRCHMYGKMQLYGTCTLPQECVYLCAPLLPAKYNFLTEIIFEAVCIPATDAADVIHSVPI